MKTKLLTFWQKGENSRSTLKSTLTTDGKLMAYCRHWWKNVERPLLFLGLWAIKLLIDVWLTLGDWLSLVQLMFVNFKISTKCKWVLSRRNKTFSKHILVSGFINTRSIQYKRIFRYFFMNLILLVLANDDLNVIISSKWVFLMENRNLVLVVMVVDSTKLFKLT